MAEENPNLIDVTAPSRLKVTKWKVRQGSKVSQGSVLGFYQLANSDIPGNQDETKQLTSPNNQLKLKASHVGTVSEIFAEEGKEIFEGSVVLQIKGCSHPTVMKDMCADCGADLRTEMGISGCRKENVSATVAMVHSIPELIVSEEQALELGRADEIRLKKTQKLVLLVDLDQTLIHTTNDDIPPNLKGIHHFQLWQGMNLLWYHTRIRPHTQQFLENISKLYELHICTFGVRMYAHTIARFIDPAGKFFSHRILSRDECFNAMSKTANLKALFPCGDSMVCIIDDREDVWNFAPNLIHVKPYRFFQCTADINAPPGLSKKENDSKPLTHHVRKVSGNSNSPEKGKYSSAGYEKYKASKNVEKKKKDVEESSVEKPEEEEGEEVEKEEEGEGKELKKEEEEGKGLKKEEEEEGKGLKKEEEGKGVEKEEDEGKGVKKEEDGGKGAKKEEDEGKEGEEVSDVVSGEQNISSISKTDADNESESTSPTIKEAVKNKSDEPKSDKEEEESKAEDLEGLSEDSSMSGMSLCDNQKNTAGKIDDSNEDENDNGDGNNDKDDNDMIEWEDNDDYLFYLEDILRRIHTAYFNISDQLDNKEKSSEINLDLKAILPYVKCKVLKGCNICFSGVIPLNTPVIKSRAYNVALSLGANVHETIIPYSSKTKKNYTTHLIANKLGTSKVHAAQRARKVLIVSLDWLWCCAERWDRVDEKLFLLKEKRPLDSDDSRSSPELSKPTKLSSKKRKSSFLEDDIYQHEAKLKKNSDSLDEQSKDENLVEDMIDSEDNEDDTNNNIDSDVKKLKRADSHYNPLYSFSDEERANMDKELEELMDEEDSSDSDEKEAEVQLRKEILRERKCDTSSEDSLSGEFPHGWKSKKWSKCRLGKKKPSTVKRDESLDSEDSEASITEKYEKSIEVFATHESDSSIEDSDCESIGSIDEEIAEAVEKEFLAR